MNKVWIIESGWLHQGGACHSVYYKSEDAQKVINQVIIDGNIENIKKFNSLSDIDKELNKEAAEFVETKHSEGTISWTDGLNYITLKDFEVQ